MQSLDFFAGRRLFGSVRHHLFAWAPSISREPKTLIGLVLNKKIGLVFQNSHLADDMTSAADNETLRLKKLRSLDILDTPLDPVLEGLTNLATLYFRVPIALVSLVDECRQWFKSAQGLDVRETPREWAFCDHAIAQNELLLIEDAQQSRRFADNPLVTGAPYIRFYAGAPVRVDDFALGTVCIIDRRPRSLTPNQLARLMQMAELVEDILSGDAPNEQA